MNRKSKSVITIILIASVIFSLQAPAQAKGKKCDKRCEVTNIKLTQQALIDKIYSDPNTVRRVLIAFASPVKGQKMDADRQSFITKIKGASSQCLLESAPATVEIVQGSNTSSQMFQNIFSSTITNIATFRLDMATSYVAGNVLEKAISKALSDKNFAIANFILFALHKDAVPAANGLCV